MTMTQRINALLAEKGIGKYQFYRDCGISSGTFSFWAQGKTVPLRKNLERIAEYLNTTVEYIETGKWPKEKPASQKEDGLTEAQAEVHVPCFWVHILQSGRSGLSIIALF